MVHVGGTAARNAAARDEESAAGKRTRTRLGLLRQHDDFVSCVVWWWGGRRDIKVRVPANAAGSCFLYVLCRMGRIGGDAAVYSGGCELRIFFHPKKK